jgi:CBS domain containing-hemolysin-like protein
MEYFLTITWKTLLIALLVLLNGFFVATEFALVKVRNTQLEALIARGSRRAKLVLHLTEHLDAYLSACQLGITATSLGLGWVGESAFEVILEPLFVILGIESPGARARIAFLVGFTTITFLHVVAGEQAPKSLSIRKPVATALFVAYPMRLFYIIGYPCIWILNKSALGLLKLVGIAPASEWEVGFTEEELKFQIASLQQRTGTPSLTRAIVQNAFELRHRFVREVMRPRHEIVYLDTEASITDCLSIVNEHRYSRYPLCEKGDLDKTVGILHVKDIYAMAPKVSKAWELRPFTKPILYLPEMGRLEKALELFLTRKTHMALVVDEYGGITGLVTLENVLEELVGEIQDEFDTEEPRVIRIDDFTWELDAALPLHQVEELVGVRLEAEGISSIAGFFMYKFGGFPKPGDKIGLHGFELSVKEMEGLRITRLILRKTNLVSDSLAGR